LDKNLEQRVGGSGSMASGYEGGGLGQPLMVGPVLAAIRVRPDYVRT